MKLSKMVEAQLNEYGPEKLGLENFTYLQYTTDGWGHLLLAYDVNTGRPAIVKKSGGAVYLQPVDFIDDWELVTEEFTVNG